MISDAWLSAQDGRALEALADSRRKIRSVYGTEEGISMLSDMAIGLGLFDRIDPEDSEAITRRNVIIDLLDSMGMLDEAHIRDIIAFMISGPVIPVREGDRND